MSGTDFPLSRLVKTVFGAFMFLVKLLGFGRPMSAQTATPLVFEGVGVIDVVKGRLMADQRVVIVGDRIQVVENTDDGSAPTQAKIVDARGKYLIPGLWDMHAHAAGHDHSHRNVYSLLIANGVTGIREMSTTWPVGFNLILQHRSEIARGTLVGPRIVATSYDFYSPICSPEAQEIHFRALYAHIPDSGRVQNMIKRATSKSGCIIMNPKTVETPSEIRQIVDMLKMAGVDFVKAHSISDSKVYFAFLNEARRIGIPPAGHLGGSDGRAVTEIEASDSGLRSVEHTGQMSCWQAKKDSTRGMYDYVARPDSFAEKQCRIVAETFKRNNTWLVPTLYVSNFPIFGDVTDSVIFNHAVAIMHRVGIPMLAGTDAYFQDDSQEQMLESALHNELALLVQTGFTPVEALRAATINPAKFFEATDSLGTIVPGKLADLVLLDANPLTDIHNTTAIRAVVANGRYFDRAELDALILQGRDRRTR